MGANEKSEFGPKLRPMNYAADETLRLIRWLLPQLQKDEIIALELPYKDVSRKADIAVIGPNRLVAIEVKGPRDNLGKLPRQLDDYVEGFLEVYVAAAPNLMPSIKALMPARIGLIDLGETAISLRRVAARRERLSKVGATHWLRADELRQILGTRRGASDIRMLRDSAIKHVPAAQLSSSALASIYERSRTKFSIFDAERGERLTLDDVETLRLPQKIR
ncbi:sce7726 family protein [Stenotrophomonas lacuserhaii]|uniref:sce7726 family protein n=1 Tax=Stenotrophomonas lacuserhaii TaxID=2760084 RepID=UPI0015FC2ABA|nr:sce7726 family protein [Stenotrophomonas lacuserhaii]